MADLICKLKDKPKSYVAGDDFTKIVRVGTGRTWGGRVYSVFCKIKYEAGELSITGVEGPLPSGNALGGCGQIIDALLPVNLKTLAPGWTRYHVKWLRDVWKRHHLNHMSAGSPRQMAWLRDNPPHAGAGYDVYVNLLTLAGLNPDTEHMHNGEAYRYGSAWLKQEIPSEILVRLSALLSTDRDPAWV